MPYLKRAEGGIGGNDNLMNKQLRFRRIQSWNKDNDIVIDNIRNSEVLGQE